MTLRTKIILQRPTPVRPLFTYCQKLLGDPSTMKTEEWTAGDDCWGFPRLNNGITNAAGQGLAAILDLQYGADGPLVPYSDASDPSGAIQVSFDTGYAYRDGNGAGCADLHAWLIVGVAQYCENRDIPYVWQNEFTQEWFNNLVDLNSFGNPLLGALQPFVGVES